MVDPGGHPFDPNQLVRGDDTRLPSHKSKTTFKIINFVFRMFPLAEHYRSVHDLVMSLQALAAGLISYSHSYPRVCRTHLAMGHIAGRFGDGHIVRFLVSHFGISWVESRNGAIW